MSTRYQLDQIARIPLMKTDSPVFQLNRIFPAENVWLKDDSRLHPVCGGNKVRRLEYLLAGLKKGRSVLTFGYECSNHVLATAYFCSLHGISTRFIVQRGPSGMSATEFEATQFKMDTVRKYASQVSVADSHRRVFLKAAATLVTGVGRVTMIPPGGSNSLGALGSMRAVFELSDQIQRGEMPRPDSIFVPLGTGGTAVGLAVGVRAVGWNTTVVAVKIASDKLNDFSRLRKMAAGMRRYLPALSPAILDLGNLEIDEGYLGDGYGRPSGESQHAIVKWFELQEIRLENIYSAKTAAALEARIHAFSGTPVLFWLTHGDFRRNS